ncbi:hypothetical protein PNU17_12690 [Turicibacter sanguinis]|uniref:hypothetical protein n=1 Tax=Turicibacter sanguinis TaxID=154288 RepID=UPI00189AC6F2|nr:hypothetical protein [Turicibacter sanguinis]MDB8556623.1 hypothetical protein [Turicibacter sanguinis]MDB8559409.1 hypothetical protein [Turicibacter sanguinis]MDB8562163.1 hypothetical protein [Turicibacter sanguinis]
MEDILFQDQLSTQNKGQSLYYNPQQTRCSKDDLIMISNCQGKYLFEEFAGGNGESPVFKVQNVCVEKGRFVLRLQVMQVLYPVPVFNHEHPRANMLQAIREGLAVVRETEKVFTFRLNETDQATEVDLREVTTVTPIQVQSPVHIDCDCQEGCRGRVEIEGGRHRNYQFFLTQKPRQGTVELNGRTGEWRYRSHREEVERDTFEITVWDGLGAYAVQRVLIDCEECGDVQGVNIVNCAVPVVACQPLPVMGKVQICNTPTVTFQQPVGVCVLASVPVDVTGTVTIVVDEPIDVAVVNGIDIANTPTVLVGNTPTVNVGNTATVNVASLPGVTVVNNPTVQVGNAIAVASLPGVTVVNTPTVNVGNTATVNVASLPGVTIVNTPTVEVGNTPTVNVASLPGVTVVNTPTVNVGNALAITSMPIVTVYIGGVSGSILSVTLAPTISVVFDEPVEVEVVNTPTVNIGNALTITSLPGITIVNVPTVTFEEPVAVCVIDSVPVSVNIINTPTVNIGNALTITSLPGITIVNVPTVTFATPVPVCVIDSISVSVNLINTPTVNIGNALTITSLPGVTIVNIPTVTFEEPVAVCVIDSVPVSVNIINTPTVNIGNALTITSLPGITIVNVPTVTFEEPVAVCVIDSVPVSVNIINTPTVNIGNALTITSLPGITIVNVPTVTFSQPVAVTFPNSASSPLYVVTVTTPVLLAANAFQQLPVRTVTIDTASATSVLYDVSNALDVTFFSHLVTQGATVTMQKLYSPVTTPGYFQAIPVVTSLQGGSENYGIQVDQLDHYAGVNFTATPISAVIEFFVDAQGPVTLIY